MQTQPCHLRGEETTMSTKLTNVYFSSIWTDGNESTAIDVCVTARVGLLISWCHRSMEPHGHTTAATL